MAQDFGIFFQMLLNGGSYGGRRILSPSKRRGHDPTSGRCRDPWIMPRIVPATGKRIDVEL